MDRASREGKDMGSTLALVEKAGNLSIEEEDVVRARLQDMEEAEEKEQANDKAIEDKIKVCVYMYVAPYAASKNKILTGGS